MLSFAQMALPGAQLLARQCNSIAVTVLQLRMVLALKSVQISMLTVNLANNHQSFSVAILGTPRAPPTLV